MGGRRTTPPLFELLGGPVAERAMRPSGFIEPSPKPKPPKQPKEPKEPRQARQPKARPAPKEKREPWRLDSAKRISIPLNAVLIGAAGLITFAVFGYAIAWQFGYSSNKAKEQRFLDQLAPGETAVVDPLVKDLPVNATLLGTNGASPSAQAQSPTGRTGTFIVAGGRRTLDPRQAGLNYLQIAGASAKIDLAEAERVVAFFDRSGLEVVCIPVDRGRGGSNNARYFDVFVLQGVPSDQFKARQQERKDLERRVEQLGKVWQREHKGTTDFSGTLWAKYVG
jgi:hypothetical protein